MTNSASNSDNLTALLKPRNIALIGASERAPHAAALMRNLFRFGFPKDCIYPRQPHATSSSSTCRANPSVGAVPGKVDLAVVAIPRDGTVQVMEECAAKGVHAALTVATGFGEFDETGRGYQAELARIVRESGMALAGPNTLGYLALESGAALWSSPLPELLTIGPVSAVFSSAGLPQPLPQHRRRPLPGVPLLRHRPRQPGGCWLHRLPPGRGGRRRHPGHRRRHRVHEPPGGDGGTAGPGAGAREGGRRPEARALPKGRQRGRLALRQHGHLRRGVGRALPAEGRHPGGQPRPDAGGHRPWPWGPRSPTVCLAPEASASSPSPGAIAASWPTSASATTWTCPSLRAPPTRRCAATSTRRASNGNPLDIEELHWADRPGYLECLETFMRDDNFAVVCCRLNLPKSPSDRLTQLYRESAAALRRGGKPFLFLSRASEQLDPCLVRVLYRAERAPAAGVREVAVCGARRPGVVAAKHGRLPGARPDHPSRTPRKPRRCERSSPEATHPTQWCGGCFGRTAYPWPPSG